MQGQIRASGSGSTVEHMRVGDAENLKIKLPHIAVQHKIASILSSYDDLIENNNCRIAILEEMARSLYCEWFVKFRFPGHEEVKMIDSELGEIPEGWEIKKTADLLKRLAVKVKYTQENVQLVGSIPVIDQSRDEVLGFHDNQADVMANNDFPIAIFGDHTCKMQLLVEPFSIGPNVIPFTSKIDRPMQYIFYLVNSLVATKEYKRHWTELIGKKVILAPQGIAEHFSGLIKPLLAQINLLKKKNQNLKTQRDMLLPKLISGKIDVNQEII
jgi:type I restriction enzyme S subunit